MMVQLLYTRYKTVLQYQKTSKNAYFCEMYLFHNLLKEMKEHTDSEMSNDKTQETKREEINNAFELTETLKFEQCQISLEQQEHTIYAQYQSDDIKHGLIITINLNTKEIIDVVYEY